ncbi:MAG: amidohydrolase family protein, partial [Leptolyngbyaceae bacterium]|nr:amidohydrolase family protein [Leptolyngbyaceae bacterium]
MSTLLIKNSQTLVTMDAARREIRHGAVFIRDQVIEQVGSTEELPSEADEILDLGDRHILLPGLVNTHHHFYQTLTRAVPAAQDGDLFTWLKTLYPMWANLTAEGVYVSAQMAAAELILSGCTTASDHLYLFPNDCTLDDEIRAIQEIGLRFH